MMKRSPQAPAAVIMIRPHHFRPNPETLVDNAFQQSSTQSQEHVSQAAFNEVTQAVATLQEHGVRVDLFEDTSQQTPDSVFPNNWFSMHAGGHIAMYPMFAENRRPERRYDIMEHLKQQFRVQDVIDYSGLEQDQLYLEGTGAMVLDHIDRVAYTAKSKRADQVLLERFCAHFNYEPMLFDAIDEQGTAIYHTNVLMCIATEFALLGSNMIQPASRRKAVTQRLQASGRELIHLSAQQIAAFAGNAIELQGANGRILALSQTAFDALTEPQKQLIEQSAKLVPLAVPTIELAGGSVRCMIAGNHLSERD